MSNYYKYKMLYGRGGWLTTVGSTRIVLKNDNGMWEAVNHHLKLAGFGVTRDSAVDDFIAQAVRYLNPCPKSLIENAQKRGVR